ncbi:PE-PGRS family protein [Mycobacterium tuberculosis CAS/NITR204]|uniref:PE-PGRS family protein n=1 Tax=Mycobacterium tuberculosis CAS/NITR204 TaxID=1310114 RepID=R4MIK7_MYCTX|nr:PE-PGRS family protein [Mycobacterium tuberculosis CAS/NITR204]
MSFVVAAPEVVVAAASDLAGIGSAIGAANAAAAVPTMGVLAAGADEVSAAVADLFGAHAQATGIECAGGAVSRAVCACHDRRRGGLCRCRGGGRAALDVPGPFQAEMPLM